MKKLGKTKRSVWVKNWKIDGMDTRLWSVKYEKTTPKIIGTTCGWTLSQTFDKLLSMVKDKIIKQDAIMRESISPEEKLTATLRYLATGRSLQI